MAAWTCYGQFTGGDICLPTLEQRIQFRPFNAMLLFACVIDHCIAPVVGSRASHVNFSKSDKGSLLKHRNQMTGQEAVDFDTQYNRDQNGKAA